MDEGGRESRRHRVDYYKVHSVKEQNAFHMNTTIGMLCDERNAAIKERDRALAEKRAALEERDIAINQRDVAIVERDNAVRERDNAIAALQFQETTMNAILGSGARGLKRMNHTNHHLNNVQPTHMLKEECISDPLPVSAVPCQSAKLYKSTNARASEDVKSKRTKSPRAKKIREDLNRQVKTDGSKSEWDAQDFNSMNQISFDGSTMPIPVCSCTGVARQCYKWSNGGWQSSCCTTSLSVYPLPHMLNKRHARMGGRKMSGSVFRRLLTRLAAAGHDLSVPLDLKNYWAKHGTNRYITIK